jgi:autotransporter passenger strand-loop-strand repeat protein
VFVLKVPRRIRLFPAARYEKTPATTIEPLVDLKRYLARLRTAKRASRRSSAAVSSGTQYVFGLAIATTVSSGGLQVVESAASATGATVSSGGQDYIVSGGLASGASVFSRGIETVFGTASGTTLSGGVQYDYAVAAGGTAVGSGAEQIVEAGAVASGLIVGRAVTLVQ